MSTIFSWAFFQFYRKYLVMETIIWFAKEKQHRSSWEEQFLPQKKFYFKTIIILDQLNEQY